MNGRHLPLQFLNLADPIPFLLVGVRFGFVGFLGVHVRVGFGYLIVLFEFLEAVHPVVLSDVDHDHEGPGYQAE